MAAICDPANQEIIAYDSGTWQNIGNIGLSQGMLCDAFTVVPNSDGMDLGYLYSTSGRGAKVYSINLNHIEDGLVLLFDSSIFPWLHSNLSYLKLAIH